MAANCSSRRARLCETSNKEGGGVYMLIRREELDSQTEFVGHHTMVAASWAELLGSFSGPQCTCICKHGKSSLGRAIHGRFRSGECLGHYQPLSWLHTSPWTHAAVQVGDALDLTDVFQHDFTAHGR